MATTVPLGDWVRRNMWFIVSCQKAVLGCQYRSARRPGITRTLIFMEKPPSPQAPRSSGWQAPAALELDAVLPGYQVIDLLGRGGMGAVYRALQPNLDRDVAIKILPLELASGGGGQHFTERFKQEAKSMARLSHPGIVQVHDFGEAEAVGGEFLYFVMEFVEGRNILQYLREEGGRLEPEHAHSIVCHVLDALGFAHQHGVIHRDIKPANIMLDQYGRVKVADFGLAKSTGQETDLTASNMAMGTPDFIAPEALESGREVDARADLYSVGAMFYQLLTGKVPRGVFQAATELVPGLDSRYDAIIMRALQHAPESRYQDAAEFRAELDRIVTEPIRELKLGIGSIPLVQPGEHRVDEEVETAPLSSPSPVAKISPESRPEQQSLSGLDQAEKGASSGFRFLLVVAIAVGVLAAGLYLLVRGGDGGDEGLGPAAAAPALVDSGPGALSAGLSGRDGQNPGVSAGAAMPGSPGGRGADSGEGSNRISPRSELDGIPGLREKLETHLTERREQIGQLAKQYGGALERGLDRAADAGELRLATAYRDERSRLVVLMQSLEFGSEDREILARVRASSGLSPLPRSSPQALADLRGTWNAEMEGIEGGWRLSARRFLMDLESELTAAGELEKAEKIAAIREGLETKRMRAKGLR